MKRLLLIAATVLAPLSGTAQTDSDIVEDIVTTHILPRFETLALTSENLAAAAQADCSTEGPALRDAYSGAFDAWVSVSHLRFGPTETDERAFALAFWPDARGATPRTLNTLLTSQDPIAQSAEAYADMSIAARGFYALEFLVYDTATSTTGDASYQCRLVRTVTADIAQTTAAILSDWQNDYAARLMTPSVDGTYRSVEEALQELFKALTTGLQFTADTRLGRPLGTFDRPRPTRAEVWRSGRSAHHVDLSLVALRDLAAHLTHGDPDLTPAIDAAFERAISQLAALDDPTFANVADPSGRIKIEVLQQSVATIQTIVRERLGPTLGVAAGFNSLDGD